MEVIDGDDREFDVEKILQTVRDRLERRSAQPPPETLSLGASRLEPHAGEPDSALIEPLGRYLSMLNRLQDPKPQGVIAAYGSPLTERVKRWLRQALAPYHRAIFIRQETFNANLVELLNHLLPAIDELAKRNAKLEGQLADLLFLRDRLAEVWGRLDSLRAEYDQAIAQIYTRLEDQILAGAEQAKRKVKVE